MVRGLIRAAIVAGAMAWAAASAPAQIVFGEMGFVILGPRATAGDPCWGFDCRARALPARAGDQLTLRLRAPLGAGFVVVASPGASSCLTVPGVHNSLVIDRPILATIAGRIDRRNTMRFCYDGWTELTLTVPRVPSGTTVAFQALAQVGTPQQPQTGWAFSSAILVGM